jgi:EAL domain-containing protein (putative c-di-GMP-specific phosphodiesterase class I)
VDVIASHVMPIAEVIQTGSVVAHYQPIISIKKKAVIGVEALCRGHIPATGALITPHVLFTQARRDHLTLELDRLCRYTALRGFRDASDPDQGRLLFLNFDTSIIDQGVVGSDCLLKTVLDLAVDPQHVVIELIESGVNQLSDLCRFVETYRAYGFHIALDDVGSGYSNLERIPLLKPMIIKIDRALVQGIHLEYQKQVVVNAIVNIAKSIGALVVAEGVETEEEAILALELGADMLQGFYFAHPLPLLQGMASVCEQPIARIAERYQEHMIRKINGVRSLHREYDRLITHIVNELARVRPDDFDMRLDAMRSLHPDIECLYILDRDGRQITRTICAPGIAGHSSLQIFRPAERGTDHSLKEYHYLLVNTSIHKYTTEPYVSLATGKLCVTISVACHDSRGRAYVLCVDMHQHFPELQQCQ